ncbi:extracellular solute-binding protein, partial [Listeria monocytogenes]|nr:extracellular solute-binding protein [Listeria monocytogenes]
MFNKKRIVKLAISLLAVGGVLAGCGNGNSADNEESKLVFWSGATKGNKDQIHEEELIKEYSEKNNIEIDYQLFNWDQLKDKIITSVAADDAPSITWGLGEWYGEFNNMGALADLSDFWKNYTD